MYKKATFYNRSRSGCLPRCTSFFKESTFFLLKLSITATRAQPHPCKVQTRPDSGSGSKLSNLEAKCVIFLNKNANVPTLAVNSNG